MGTGLSFGYGFQRLIDAQQRFMRSGQPVYLRLRNFANALATPAAQLGFSVSATGSAVGTTDVLIDPPPGVVKVSIHNIGQSMGKLRFGARMFRVSASFTDAQVISRNLASADLVWRSPDVVGLVNSNLLFSIEDIGSVEVAGRTVFWWLTCNSNELR
jgi:hypothetical protein